MPDPITPEQLARLRQLHEAATAGPWGWRGHDDRLVELRGHGPFGAFDGRVISAQRSEPCIVATHEDEVVLTLEACDECRLKWAQMLEQGHTDMWEGYRCPKPENLATVWLRGKHAIEPANTWAAREQPYRSDVARVDHPDAELIAEGRNALPGLLDELEELRITLNGCGCPAPYTECPHDEPLVATLDRLQRRVVSLLEVLDYQHHQEFGCLCPPHANGCVLTEDWVPPSVRRPERRREAARG